MRLIAGWITSLLVVFTPLWDGQTRFTVISHNDSGITIHSFDPQSLQGTRIKLPDNLNIVSADGRGQWLAKNIFKAGSSKWAADSIAGYLGISYLEIREDLGIWSKISWARYESRINWMELDLTRGGLTRTITTVDDQKVLELTASWYDQSKLWFASQKIADSHLGVVVVNTTDALGLGSQAANVVESMGFKVEAVTSNQELVDRCRVLAPQELIDTLAVKLLAKNFNCAIWLGQSPRLQLILGSDYKIKLRGELFFGRGGFVV